MVDKKAVINVINKDASLTGYYANSAGDMCIIGGLAFECGIPLDYLIDCEAESITLIPKEAEVRKAQKARKLGKVRRLIREKFGLRLPELYKLQNINDFYDNHQKRRDKLIKYIQSL